MTKFSQFDVDRINLKNAPKSRQNEPQRVKVKRKASYDPKIVTAFFKEHGIPEPLWEFQFHSVRKWRFDMSWATNEPHKEGGVFLEVNGGIFIRGAHSRGAQTLKDWEKWNEAVCMGWKPLFCQPCDLCTKQMADTIKRALGI